MHFRPIAPRSLLCRSSPELPNRQPNGSQARAAMPSNAVALALNICMFSHYICIVQNCLEMLRFGFLKPCADGRCGSLWSNCTFEQVGFPKLKSLRRRPHNPSPSAPARRAVLFAPSTALELDPSSLGPPADSDLELHLNTLN